MRRGRSMNILFSPPDITDEEINEVAEALRSGWITTGPKTKKFEEKIAGRSGTTGRYFGHQLYEADRTGTEKGPCEAASALENASTERPSWENDRQTAGCPKSWLAECGGHRPEHRLI